MKVTKELPTNKATDNFSRKGEFVLNNLNNTSPMGIKDNIPNEINK